MKIKFKKTNFQNRTVVLFPFYPISESRKIGNYFRIVQICDLANEAAPSANSDISCFVSGFALFPGES